MKGLKFRGRAIRPWRFALQIGALIFLLGGAFGLRSFGEYPALRSIFLPNASCRYLNTAPTYCFYYTLQDGLTAGAATIWVEVIIVLLIVTLLILLLGRVWCSWLCPFGLVQELIMDLRNFLKIPPLRLKWSHLQILDRVKYALLFFTVLISISIGISELGLASHATSWSLPFCQVCPAKGFFTIAQQVVGLESSSTRLPLMAWIMLSIFLVVSFPIKMFWCRVCPMGAYMSLLSKKSYLWLEKDPDKCTKCRICLRVCPVDHDRVFEEMEGLDVGGRDCTLCGKCIEMCPEDGCLSLSAGSRRLVSSRKPDLGRSDASTGSRDRSRK